MVRTRRSCAWLAGGFIPHPFRHNCPLFSRLSDSGGLDGLDEIPLEDRSILATESMDSSASEGLKVVA